MATIDWNGGSGDWNDPSDWTPEQVPTTGDTATITGTIASDVLINGNETVSVAGVTIDNPLASLEVDGYLSADTIALQAGTITDDGTIANATIALDGGSLDFGFGLLYNDKIEGALVLGGSGTAEIQGTFAATGIDGTGPGTITIDGADSTLLFNDATDSLDNTTITIGSAGGLDSLSAGGVLTLGTGVVVQTTTTAFLDVALASDGAGTIINDGSIIADAASGEMDLESPAFINNGAITVAGGADLEITPYGTFANTGLLTIGNASTATIAYLNTFTNT
ncbi:hypothetical protein ACELLULO517_04300, partial [Acidisoma cellulosilytica]